MIPFTNQPHKVLFTLKKNIKATCDCFNANTIAIVISVCLVVLDGTSWHLGGAGAVSTVSMIINSIVLLERLMVVDG